MEHAESVAEELMFPAIATLPDDFMTRAHFERVIRTLNFDSTPGLPYCRTQPTIGQWLGWNGLEFDPYKVDALWHDVQMLLEGDDDVLYKAFIKLEPHKKVKVEQGRWRIIICFPLHLQVLWKMVSDHLNTSLVKNAIDIPCKQGFTLARGDWKIYYQQWKQIGYNAGTDASAWDWCFNEWMMRFVINMRLRLTRGTKKDMQTYERLLRKIYALAFMPGARIVLPDGTVLEQLFIGLEKSGSPNTISDNTFARLGASIIVCMMLGLPLTRDNIGDFVGDDELKRLLRDPTFIERLKLAYLRLGIVIKQIDWGLEFIGHRFEADGPKPMYFSKHIWKFYYVSDEDLNTFLDSMLRLYCHSEQYWYWEQVARDLGVRVYSRSYYLTWYDCEEFTPMLPGEETVRHLSYTDVC